jgi:1-aminocyclopropane-1-carboxylate deaminase/D-cysteine desulfhydrase-like pyridoxal-dependent ACC family enzyme
MSDNTSNDSTGSMEQFMDPVSFHMIFQNLNLHALSKANVQVNVLRLDLIDPIYGGNKWFKLKYNLIEAKRLNQATLLSFGGAFSNHIAALARVGKLYNFKTIGIIRGETTSISNPTLKRASEDGMQLHFVSREEYRLLRENKDSVSKQFENCYIIPEGGSNTLGVKGCIDIGKLISEDTDYVVLPIATGSTLAGVYIGAPNSCNVIGISVLKGESFLESDVLAKISRRDLMTSMPNDKFRLIHDYSFGGYAKSNNMLTNWIAEFEKQTGILIEPIYSGKLFYGFFDLLSKNYFKKGSKITLIHTGGRQYLES